MRVGENFTLMDVQKVKNMKQTSYCSVESESWSGSDLEKKFTVLTPMPCSNYLIALQMVLY